MAPSDRDTIDGWASDFADTPAFERLEGVAKEHAPVIVHTFLKEACACGHCAPADLTAEAVRHALLDHMPALNLPGAAREQIPSIVRDFLESLEDAGRLAGGRALGRQAAASAEAFRERLNPKGGARAPALKAASSVGRNDPCPCGSGRKYKKCCGG